jgi:hypothetical protein
MDGTAGDGSSTPTTMIILIIYKSGHGKNGSQKKQKCSKKYLITDNNKYPAPEGVGLFFAKIFSLFSKKMTAVFAL